LTNILIVDDDERIRKVIKIQLRETGFEIFEASCGQEAFSVLSRVAVSLVVCDIKMKGMNGLEVMKAARAAYPGLPFVILTGLIGDAYVREAEQAGCRAYLTKPVKKEILVQAVRDALERSPPAG
jgi:CheY-like chemotaxis protein